MGPQDVGVSSHWLCRVLSQSMALEFPLSWQGSERSEDEGEGVFADLGVFCRKRFPPEIRRCHVPPFNSIIGRSNSVRIRAAAIPPTCRRRL